MLTNYLAGRKRVREVETELRVLQSLRHPNLAPLYYTELRDSGHGGHPTLYILTQKPHALNLQDVLEQLDVLRTEKAVVCLAIAPL